MSPKSQYPEVLAPSFLCPRPWLSVSMRWMLSHNQVQATSHSLGRCGTPPGDGRSHHAMRLCHIEETTAKDHPCFPCVFCSSLSLSLPLHHLQVQLVQLVQLKASEKQLNNRCTRVDSSVNCFPLMVRISGVHPSTQKHMGKLGSPCFGGWTSTRNPTWNRTNRGDKDIPVGVNILPFESFTISPTWKKLRPMFWIMIFSFDKWRWNRLLRRFSLKALESSTHLGVQFHLQWAYDWPDKKWCPIYPNPNW